MHDRVFAFVRDEERGQTMAEYAIVASVIAIGVLGALSALGTQITAGVQAIADLVGSVT